MKPMVEEWTKQMLMWVVSCPGTVRMRRVKTFASCRMSPLHSDWVRELPPWRRCDVVFGSPGSEGVLIVPLVCAFRVSKGGGLQCSR